MAFMDVIKDTLDEEFNISVTENGAVGYATTGKKLLDLNFSVASLRKATEDEIFKKFGYAFDENPNLAMRWLFYARDIRGGLGERRLFRVILCRLAIYRPNIINRLVPIIAEYGRFDDMWPLLKYRKVCDSVVSFVRRQITEDISNAEEGKSISLLAKWMPSINASSEETKLYGRILCRKLGLTERQYRKTLSKLRGCVDVVERKMSNKEWNAIKYESVPSRANLIYNDAFLRNDENRRREYLSKLSRGETKINSSTLFPHEIVNKYEKYDYGYGIGDTDDTIEALWKALPDMVQGCGNTMVVADGSGSMMCRVDRNSNVTALTVANALAIYFSERSSGEFKNKYITFSSNPRFVDFSPFASLSDKIKHARKFNECSNTNIEKVFDLILSAAINNHMRQEDMPKNILIISDMEFDSATYDGYYRNANDRLNKKLFSYIGEKYKSNGYKMPRLVFWNVNSRTSTIPVKENDLGVALVSGFSTNICKMVMSGKTDPYECLVEALMNKRYDLVETTLR